VRDLAQLASRLFLPIGVRMGECLNDENEGDEADNSQHSDPTLSSCEPAPHSLLPQSK